MPWGEAVRHARTLVSDPSSHTFAAQAGWQFPASRELQVAMDLFDLQFAVAWRDSDPASRGPRPKPVPRPWPMPDEAGNASPRRSGTGQIGNTDGRSRAEVVEYLNSLGHHLTA